ncbi:MAG: CDP-paratose 2-epimerase [Bdellovibrionales bacterium RIFOXYD1_FULL_53_11]|nr:MAG: CDP-paratose 2-epimerase [Bdellovibrionales bacterium RIFOXYD1_FULL_53_11]
MKRFLITGGCGFLGTNLAQEALGRGGEVCIIDNLSRRGGTENLEWLRKSGNFEFHRHDTKDLPFIENTVRAFGPDVIFHLAGQVAMTTSIADPRLDFETNVVGGHNILEAVRRHSPGTVVFYSSTNKVYGDLDRCKYEERGLRYVAPGFEHGFDETVPLDFRSPYGCSKGAMDQYMLDYARVFGLKTIVFRHSSIFGGRQFSTYDQGWIGWFVMQALGAKRGTLAEPFTISGDGKQVRDVLFASDLVGCYFEALANADKAAGNAFNIGGGMENSLSLLELFEFLQQELDIKLEYTKLPWRKSDQKVFVADIRKAGRIFGWKPRVACKDGLRRMITWVGQNMDGLK